MATQVMERKASATGRTLRILGMSGSARKNSFNMALLHAAKDLVPPGVTLEIFDLTTLPMYNQDLESAIPEAVLRFKEEIMKADAILFSTPEYNYSISALLKNAIEWGNRPAVDNSWDGKPAAMMSASTSLRGGVRAQLHLRHIMVDLNIHPVNQPQLLVAKAQEKFDAEMKLTDEAVKETLRNLLLSLVQWTMKLQSGTLGA